MFRYVLKDSFYTIISILPGENKNEALGMDPRAFTAKIKLNEHHPVYDGHFPGNPVVPGVCQVQIVKEIFSEILQKEVILAKSDNIKFLNIIIPGTYPLLDIKIIVKRQKEEGWDVSGTISDDELLFLKFKGIFLEK